MFMLIVIGYFAARITSPRGINLQKPSVKYNLTVRDHLYRNWRWYLKAGVNKIYIIISINIFKFMRPL